MKNKKQLAPDELKNVSLNVLPRWVLGKIARKGTVIERLRLEGVDRRWNGVVWEFGWTGQKKLSYEIVFRGAREALRYAFTPESLVALFKRIGKNLLELDLSAFRWYSNYGQVLRPAPWDIVCPAISLLSNLSVIRLADISLGTNFFSSTAVPFLPSTLREIHMSGYDETTLSALATKCPNLVAIDFDSNYGFVMNAGSMNDFLQKYPLLKKLRINCETHRGALASIGGPLKELEDFEITIAPPDHPDTDYGLHHHNMYTVDDATVVAMVEGCKRLRRLVIRTGIEISEQAFCQLANLPILEELVLSGWHLTVTDAVVEAISKCQNLKSLNVATMDQLTDASIIAVIQNCKHLTELTVSNCKGVTGKSLEALVVELRRRHGASWWCVADEPQIFRFACDGSGIPMDEALKAVPEAHFWLRIVRPVLQVF